MLFPWQLRLPWMWFETISMASGSASWLPTYDALPPMSTLAVPIQHDVTFEMLRLPPTELSSYVLKTGLPKALKTPIGSQVSPPPPPCCSTFPPIVALWTITPSAWDEVTLPLTVAVTVNVGLSGLSSKHGELTGLQPRSSEASPFTLTLPLTVTSDPVAPNAAMSAPP